MPTAMTFASLQSDVQSYLERGTSTDALVFAQLPKLINNAERRIARVLKILGFQIPVTSAFTPGLAIIAKPDRWRETISWNFGVANAFGNNNKRQPLFRRSYEYVRSFWPDDSQVAMPKFYADYDYNNWIVGPTPDQAYPFEVVYWQLPALLDAINTTNWTTAYAPEALLYSTLMECEPYLKNDPRMSTWKAMYAEAMAGLEKENVQDIMSRANTTHKGDKP